MEKNGILLLHGTDHQDMTLRILREAKLTEHLTDKAMRIGIKPNLVVAASADGGAIGVGRCTGCFARSAGGCPPTAAQMLAFLEDNWQ